MNVNEIDKTASYWAWPVNELFAILGSSKQGLGDEDVKLRILLNGPNTVAEDDSSAHTFRLFLQHFKNPIMLILIIAALVAMMVQDWLNATIILGIVLLSVIMSFIQEYRAALALKKLNEEVQAKTEVLREGQRITIPTKDVVPGDIVLLKAGSLIPGDGVLTESKDFYVSQALLTGETYPVEKQPGTIPKDAGLLERTNCVFMGTSVRSGTATAVIVHTGKSTHFGEIAHSLELSPPETEFERGLRHFGAMLVRIMLVIVLSILLLNIVLHHPTIETVLFAMALAVGLSPEMLPAILTITLSRGAQEMAKQGVIVRRLNAIENFGSMDVLCTDKTGTLTRGVVKLDKALDVTGLTSEFVFQLAFLNSYFETGLTNPVDEALIEAGTQHNLNTNGYIKRDEIPYDFIRKRLSIVVERKDDAKVQIITKGSLQTILAICDSVQTSSGTQPITDEYQKVIQQQFSDWSTEGFRVLGVAYKSLDDAKSYTRNDEKTMTFAGFLLFFDPPEEGTRKTLRALQRMGVQLKIITGDNRYVASHVARALGIRCKNTITGADLADMKDEALWHLAPRVNLFAEVDPNQKERIIEALQKTGHVVGYLGDGINDAPALHAADVGISVDQAADVAKEAADFILIKHDLEVLRKGIDQGRHTFANTLKYIFITTSANFGNMVSMALASVFLPFLPLLAKQILLNNFLSDIPALGIAADKVDRDWERTPHRWDIRLIRNFMITFGLLSVMFDLLTFAVLLYLAGAVAEVFRTGWFVESLLTELLVMLIIRTHLPTHKSSPGRFLLLSSIAIAVIAVMIPYLNTSELFGFQPLSGSILLAIVFITGLYGVMCEVTKHYFFERVKKLNR